MKYPGLTFLLLFLLPFVARSQATTDERAMFLPKPTEIGRITVEPGMLKWYTPESLLQLLPHFIAREGTYGEEKFPQRGAFVLKNGTVIRWTAANYYSLEVETKTGTHLFVLPAQCSLTGPEKGLAALRSAPPPIFHHPGDIFLASTPAGPAIRLEYMLLEDAFDRPNAPGLSAEFACQNGRASDTVSLHFWATGRLDGQPLAVLVDGQILKRRVLGLPADASLEDLGLVIYTIELPRDTFLKMTGAKSVEVLAGLKTFPLNSGHLVALRDLASRIER
jgi:hypothetical protein